MPPAGDDWAAFAAAAAEWGIPLSAAQLEAFERYLRELSAWNRRFNLTRITAPEEILVKHFLDSLSCALVVDFTTRDRLLDVGSGAGFPGVPLKIAFPHLQLTALDSLRKRTGFLDRLAELLSLERFDAVHARAEDAGRDPRWREQFDVVTARAVARLDRLGEWLLPFARVGGDCVAMKGPGAAAEVAAAMPLLRAMGAGEPVTLDFELPLLPVGRSLVRIPKRRPTPPAYPRSPGAAKREPPGA